MSESELIDVQVVLREAVKLRSTVIEEADDADDSELPEHLERITKIQRGIQALRQILAEETLVDSLNLEGDARLDALMSLPKQ
jgi:uncharacterized protein YutE (UPF0331/DUF86 family)